ncbi:hypothetical protein [Sphingomonas oryzagri]|uniref:Uncharacterized protein n=1 Tax=Sphingomonas oryzagri TaxID=3042314 RepID=A0ABT6N1J3_9SPHN|nr:hypothetical protein [Sphingomonas oryzagri]MDH7638921.1 hypothetical protein [Sphingomonas oryzagri]
METLLQLAERVEGLAGPNRNVDALIAPLQGLRVVDEGHPIGRMCYDDIGAAQLMPRYTASLDAAMSLVPEGQGVQVDRYWIASVDGPVWHAHVTSPTTKPNVIVGSDYNEAWDCASAALALCAASLKAIHALRARAAEQKEPL